MCEQMQRSGKEETRLTHCEDSNKVEQEEDKELSRGPAQSGEEIQDNVEANSYHKLDKVSSQHESLKPEEIQDDSRPLVERK